MAASKSDVLQKLEQNLDAQVQAALRTFAADRVLARVDSIVKRRTARGEFLEGSTPGASRYRSSSHKKRREQKGLGIDRVDLFFSGDMLRATRADTRTEAENGRATLFMRYGYLEGASEAKAMTIADYHNRQGAGKGRVLRKFIGLTDDEFDPIKGDVERDLAEHVRVTLGRVL